MSAVLLWIYEDRDRCDAVLCDRKLFVDGVVLQVGFTVYFRKRLAKWLGMRPQRHQYASYKADASSHYKTHSLFKRTWTGGIRGLPILNLTLYGLLLTHKGVPIHHGIPTYRRTV